MKRPIQHKLLKNGRHFKMLYLICLQYAMDVEPWFRSNLDGTFIFRENNPDIRKKIYSNFANIIPTFEKFSQLMDEICGDYTALFVLNGAGNESKEWHERVFWFKAPLIPDEWQFGSKVVKEFDRERFDKNKKQDIW